MEEYTFPGDETAGLCQLASMLRRMHDDLKKELASVDRKLSEALYLHYDEVPAMMDLYHHFLPISRELRWHLMKEEKILFPYIGRLGRYCSPQQGILTNALELLAKDHSDIEGYFREVKSINSSMEYDGTMPQKICELSLSFLQLESKLERILRMEAFLLFPKALELEHRLLKEK